MINARLPLLLALTLTASTTAHADSLADVYQQALSNDQTYQQARATWQAAQEDLPIAIAAYLPSVSSAANFAEQRDKVGSEGKWTHSNVHSNSITATQQLINFTAMNAIGVGSLNVKAASATYMDAKQSLIKRTIQAYLKVLQDEANLQHIMANKKANYQDMLTQQQQYKVGLVAITGLYEAKSDYDNMRAQEISARAAIQNSLEALRTITNHSYRTLSTIRGQVPLLNPKPNNIDTWVSLAEQHNFALEAQNFTTQASHRGIFTQASAWLPSAKVTGHYAMSNSAGAPQTNTYNRDVTLNLSWSPINGGANFANTRQARYRYLASAAKLQATHRSTISDTRQNFLSVTSGISKIRADKQAIKSASKKLEATQAGYKVGTRTMVDILEATSNLYKVKYNYAIDQYAYLNAIIALKADTGSLTEQDVLMVDRWLKGRVNFNRLARTSKARKRFTLPRPKPASPAAATLPPKTAVRAQPNAAFSIQLFATRSKQQAQRFIRQLANPANTRIRAENGVFKVLQGQFNDKTSALAAIKQLPNKMKVHQPWVYQKKTHTSG